MKTLILALCMAAPCNAHASSMSDLKGASGLKPDEVRSSIPVPLASERMFGDGNSYLSGSGSSFRKTSYRYQGCFASEQAAAAELNTVVTGLKALKFPVLQSRVNPDANCIDYSIYYVSNLKYDSFSYVGWFPGLDTANAELKKAVDNLKKAGIPVLQATVNSKAEGIDFSVYYLANAELTKNEYEGFLPTPAEARKAMQEAEDSLSAAGMPVLESVVRTEARGSDYAIWYLVPKGPTPQASGSSSDDPAPAVVTPDAPETGCRVTNNSWTVDVHCPTNNVRCFADGTINGNPVTIKGACVPTSEAGSCYGVGSNAVNFCR